MKKSFIIIVLVLSLLPLIAVYHQIGGCTTPGSANSIAIVGNIAYIADGDLQIIDITDPQNPILLGSHITQDNAVSIAVENSIAYVADWSSGLQIIDVSNPQNPFLLSTYHAGNLNYAFEVKVSSGIAYVLQEMYGGFPNYSYSIMHILDVSNPQNPFYLGYFACPTSIMMDNNLAFMTSDSGLQVYDVSNPQNITLIVTYDTPGTACYVAVSDSIAFVMDDTAGLLILNLSDLQNPVLLASYPASGSIGVEGSQAFLTGYNGLRIIDVSDLQNPVLTGYFSCDAWSAAIEGSIAYVAGGSSGLRIIDISDPQNPTCLLGFLSFSGYANSMAISANTAYVSQGYINNDQQWVGGLQIVDVSNPQNPALLGTYDTLDGINGLAVSANIAYIACGDQGNLYGGCLYLIDVSNSLNPAPLDSLETPGCAYTVEVHGNIAYVADGELRFIDVSDPQNLTLVGSYNTWGWAYAVSVTGSIAYVAAGNAGLQIIDVSNLQNPVLLGSVYPLNNPKSVTVYGNTAYMIGNSELQIIDVTDPASPALINTIQPHASSYINQCYIHDSLLFVSDANWNEISIYNINNPQLPVLNDHFIWNLCTDCLCIAEDILYTANGWFGLNNLNLTMLDADDEVQYPATSFPMKNYPNPFNSETTISYTLPAKEQVCLEIYNSKGQLVRSLLNEQQPKGEHSLSWNGKDNDGQSVASGLYLCRITSAGKHESRKMLLLK